MQRRQKPFSSDESGVTSIEYALIASLVSIAILGALMGLSPEIRGLFDQIVAGLSAAS